MCLASLMIKISLQVKQQRTSLYIPEKRLTDDLQSAQWPVYPISVQAGLDWKGEGSMESFEGRATHFWAVQKS